MPKETARKARMPIKRAKVRVPKAKERKGQENRQKGKEGDRKGKGKGKDQKRNGDVLHLWEARTFLPEAVGETIFNRLQVIQPIHLLGGASVTTHTVGQQQANVSQKD